MKDIEVTKELRVDVENNQNQLKNAIRNHQDIVVKLAEDPDNVDLQKQINKAEEEIIAIGNAQKTLFERLRGEYKKHQNSLKATIVKSSIEERRFNLSTALSRARKQNIVARPTAFSIASSFSDESADAISIHSSPEQQIFRPVDPHDVTQPEFLNNFGLVTHEVYKEMQNKRVERKRRSTANPHFLYGSKGWDYPPKRRRNNVLYSSVSPPNTRQAVRNKGKTERISPPLPPPPPQPQPNNATTAKVVTTTTRSFPAIPNLPSGLTIERVSPTCSSPDAKSCVTCGQSGMLSICESCANGFHVSCHNRPLSQSPRRCPKCLITKEVHTVGSLNVPSGMSVSYVSAEVTERIEEKDHLQAANKDLSAELTQLQDRHSQLTISLKNQKIEQDVLVQNHQFTEEQIRKILDFVNDFKHNNLVNNSSGQSSPQPEAAPPPEEGAPQPEEGAPQPEEGAPQPEEGAPQPEGDEDV